MFSVVICTYNREEILAVSLDNLLHQADLQHVDEVIVIDNASTDGTANAIRNLATTHSKVKYIYEPMSGLSYARNRGGKEAKSKYVFYLDDDALADTNTFSLAFQNITEHPHIKALGGVYVPWYLQGRTKWYKDHYGSKYFSRNGLHELKEHEYWSGGIMIVEKELLQKAGYFNPQLGMKNDQIFYGEELDLQKRIENLGVKVYGNDNLVIQHLVKPDRQSISSIFHQKKKMGISNAMIYKMNNQKYSFMEVLKGMGIMLGQTTVYTPVNVLKLVRRNYYWQNFVIDSFAKPYKWMWYARTIITYRNKTD